MRAGIKMLCVTNWGAVLELKTHPYFWVTTYKHDNTKMPAQQCFNEVLTVADPDAIDAGQTISLDEIKLVVRRKRI